MSTENSVPATPRRTLSVRYIVSTAMLSAVAFALTIFPKFPLPVMPSFIKLDVSDLPALIGAFAFGPACGVLISLLKNLLNVAIEGSVTVLVGELCNFALGAVLAAVAGIVYRARKDRNGAILGSVLGAVASGAASVPLNYFLMYPAYAAAFFKDMPMEEGMKIIIKMYQAILPAADSLLKCLLIFNLPFTVAKGLLCATLCFLIYKPLSPLLHGRR